MYSLDDLIHPFDKRVIRNNYQKQYNKRMSKESITYRLRKMVAAAKDRCKRTGREFSITFDDVVWPDVCPVFGTPFNLASKGKPSFNSPALDRIDNDKGYIPGNVRVVSQRANQLKTNMSYNDIRLLYENFYKIS